MEAQVPAEGIVLTKDFGNAKAYEVICDCTNPDHTHKVWVDSDNGQVTVTTYTMQTTAYWDEYFETRYDIENDVLQSIEYGYKYYINQIIRNIKLTWQLWTKGYIKYEASLIMSKQQALNYAATLNQAVVDVEQFKKDRKNRK